MADDKPDKNKISKTQALRTLGSILSTALVLYLIVKEKENISDAIRAVDYSIFLLLLGLTVLSRFFVWLRWHILLTSGGCEISVAKSLRLFFSGLFASNFLPSTIGGDVVRFGGGISLGLSSPVVAASLIMDRLIGMAGMAFVLPFGIQPLIKTHIGQAGIVYMKSLAMTGVTAVVSKILTWLRQAFQNVKEATSLWIKHPFSIGLSFLATCGHMICLFATMWVIFDKLEAPIPLLLIAGLWSASYFFTLLPISINGIGLQELSLTYLFVTYGHLEVNTVVVAALLVRILQTLLSLPGAFFLPGFIRKKDSNGHLAP